jgi:hypothetical protein
MTGVGGEASVVRKWDGEGVVVDKWIDISGVEGLY